MLLHSRGLMNQELCSCTSLSQRHSSSQKAKCVAHKSHIPHIGEGLGLGSVAGTFWHGGRVLSVRIAGQVHSRVLVMESDLTSKATSSLWAPQAE